MSERAAVMFQVFVDNKYVALLNDLSAALEWAREYKGNGNVTLFWIDTLNRRGHIEQ